MGSFQDALAKCRLGRGDCPEGQRFIEGNAAHNAAHDWDDSGRDMRCAICRGMRCICGNVYDCEHDVDQRHGWSPLDFEYFEDGSKRPWRNGEGPYVLRSKRDGTYIGREPDGNTPARLCWPSKLNRHVRHFESRAEAQRYIDEGKTGAFPGSPAFEPHKIVRVRPIVRVTDG